MPMAEYMDWAAKVYDTFERVPAGDAHGVDAKAMRAQHASNAAKRSGRAPADALAGFIRWGKEHQVFANFRPAGAVDLGIVLNAARGWDADTFGPWTKAELKRAFETLRPKSTTARRVAVDMLI